MHFYTQLNMYRNLRIKMTKYILFTRTVMNIYYDILLSLLIGIIYRHIFNYRLNEFCNENEVICTIRIDNDLMYIKYKYEFLNIVMVKCINQIRYL